MKTNYTNRVIALLFGNILLGASIGIFRIVNLGTDPFSSMIIGISNTTGISFGNIQLLVCLAMFVLVLMFKRENIGLGTLPSIFMNGYISDFVYHICKNSFFDTENFLLKIVVLAAALFICTLGVAIYIEASFGTSAYDTLAMIMEDKSRGKISFKAGRVFTDIFCLATGLLLGASIGINTVVMAVFTGVMVNYFRQKIKSIYCGDIQFAI